ncbi:hypothetical protein ACH5RR_015742 [Cinchona calisaya]|uniref:RNase H type-1 domain-containing protein n=1 Tax=Cinchona calisaya TaxID=153742 RepID=A0ABD2ZV85_9GENT
MEKDVSDSLYDTDPVDGFHYPRPMNNYQYLYLNVRNLEWDSLINASFGNAKSTTIERRNLWSGLASLSSLVIGPQLIRGDFNAILSLAEYSGRVVQNLRDIDDFSSAMNVCSVSALPYSGKLNYTSSKSGACPLRSNLATIIPANPFPRHVWIGIHPSWQVIHHQTLKSTVPQTVLWEPSPSEYLKLNVDTSSLGNLGAASGGGIVQIASGLSLAGFSTAFGVRSNMEAEILTLEAGFSFVLIKDGLICLMRWIH